MSVPVTTARVLLSQARDEDRFLPEGPKAVAVGGRPTLAWVNIQEAADATAGAVHLLDWETSELRTLPQPGRPGFLLPTDRPDTVFVGMGKEVGLLNLVSNVWQPLARIPDENPRTMINDGAVAGDGVVVFGTKDFQGKDPLAHLYGYSVADRRVTTLLAGQTISNGKVASPDGRQVWDIDTPRRVVNRYTRTAAGDLRDAAVAVDLRSAVGFPDGMCDGGDGTVIVAFYNPDPEPFGRAGRYRLDTGALVEEWHTPGSPRVTCPILVRRHGRVQLVLTTATEGMPAAMRAKCPDAGSLFVADTAIEALPAEPALKLL